MPSRAISAVAARLAMVVRAPAPSVTLTASAIPANGATRARISSASADSGGVVSEVTTKVPARNRVSSPLAAGRSALAASEDASICVINGPKLSNAAAN